MKPSFDFFAVIIPSLNSIIEFLAKELIFFFEIFENQSCSDLKSDKEG